MGGGGGGGENSKNSKTCLTTSQRERESWKNSKTLFYKDCILGSVKNLSTTSQRERHRHRQRDTDRERHRQRHRERHRQRQRMENESQMETVDEVILYQSVRRSVSLACICSTDVRVLSVMRNTLRHARSLNTHDFNLFLVCCFGYVRVSGLFSAMD